ncbi:MAG: flagellar hook capping FlgD N-terminal domain-containing protein [Pseudomonadota bacterium]
MSSVDLVSSLTSTTASTSTTTTTADDSTSIDFMELFLVQLQNQDPLDPMETSEMTSQLCSLSQLEQQQQTNEYLAEQIQLQQSICNSQAVQLIGKSVSVEGNELEKYNDETSDMIVELESDCSSAVITIYDEAGDLVKTISATDLSEGKNTIEWDGTDDDGVEVEDGNYTYLVSLTDSTAADQDIVQYVSYSIAAATNRDSEAYLVTTGGKEILYEDVDMAMAA